MKLKGAILYILAVLGLIFYAELKYNVNGYWHMIPFMINLFIVWYALDKENAQ